MLGPVAGKEAEAVMPLLEEGELAIDAADALGRMGAAARPAMKRLAKMLESEDKGVQWAAVRAMSQIGGKDAYPAVDYMIKALPTAVGGGFVQHDDLFIVAGAGGAGCGGGDKGGEVEESDVAAGDVVGDVAGEGVSVAGGWDGDGAGGNDTGSADAGVGGRGGDGAGDAGGGRGGDWAGGDWARGGEFERSEG